MASQRVVVIASWASAGVLLASLASTATASLRPTLPVDPAASVSRAAQFRQTFGLESGDDHVWASIVDPYVFPDLSGGVPLSFGEAEDLDSRQVAASELRPALDWAYDRSAFAGAYIDQLSNGLLVFLVTSDAQAFAQGIEERLPGREVEVRIVDRTLTELTDMKRSISGQRELLWADGVRVMSVAVDVQTNRVEVGVLELTEGARRTINRIDSSIVVFQRPPAVLDCSMTSCSPPMKGGLDIWTPWNSSYQGNDDPTACTSGFMARRVDGTHNNVGIVTAGHCVGYKQDKHLDTWKFGTEGTIGTQNDNDGWFNYSRGDVAFIDLNDSWDSGDLNNYLGRPDNSPPTVKEFTSTTHWSYQITGLAVCRNGYGSWQQLGQGRHCGTITEFDTDNTATVRDNQTCEGTDCRYIYNTKAVSFDSRAGDSGGPVYQKEFSSSSADLFGTHNDSVPDGNQGIGPDNDEFGWYTTVSEAQATFTYQLGGMVIVPCLDGNC